MVLVWDRLLKSVAGWLQEEHLGGMNSEPIGLDFAQMKVHLERMMWIAVGDWSRQHHLRSFIRLFQHPRIQLLAAPQNLLRASSQSLHLRLP